LLDDLKRSGAPEEIIRNYEKRKENDDFLVHEDNWQAARLFQGCLTQWRYAGMNGVRTGLDYGAVRIVAEAKDIEMAAAFDGLQVMEAESLRIFAEKD